jgi:WD40 repeat protein
VVDPNNYLPYISDRYDFKHDILEEIDRNERSFKMVAEKMIQKSSLLEVKCDDNSNINGSVEVGTQGSQRRLMHFKLYDKIAHRFHGDAKVSQGVPYCIAALEDFIAIGSSDGSVRLFDSHNETELKCLSQNSMKNNAVTCLDIKRVKGNNLLHVIAGHAKGQVVLYEIKGLPKHDKKKLLNLITFRVLKTVSDTH